MVIDLSAHGLRGRTRFGASTVEDLANYAKGAIGEIAGDRGVKARVVAEAIRAVTGIAPVVDTRDPNVTWVRTVPAHAKWTEAILLKAATKGPDARPADMKLDVMPAVTPLFLKRLLPVLVLSAGAAFAIGYYSGRK